MWRNRSLAGLISAELISLTGSSMTFVALPYFVYVTTGSFAKINPEPGEKPMASS